MNIYTIGYERFTLESFVNCLKTEHVTRIVDVREIPISRKKGFSKRTLSATLNSADINYTHLKKLGCPKPIRDNLKHTGDWTSYQQAYLQHLAQQSVPLAELVKLACDEPTGLLCYEADYNRCHRSLVATAAVEMSTELQLTVKHLTLKTMIPELF